MCLLDGAGKLLERYIANCLVHHLSCAGPDLDGAHYRFRKGLSTLDAIRRVRGLTEPETSPRKVVLAISLDISNAFSALFWEKIRKAHTTH